MMGEFDTTKYLKRVIVVSWIALVLCFAIKLLGGDIFDIVCKNKNFIAVCNYADTHLWAEYCLCALYCFISLYFYTLAVIKRIRYKKWELCVLIITVLGGTAIKVWSATYGWFFDIWQMFILQAIFMYKTPKQWYRILIGAVLLIIFQMASMYIKDASFDDIYNNSVIGAIFMIDVWFMLMLYYGYSNVLNLKKERKKNE
jgi:MFS superfamily sulfate permease-like transporter